MNRFELTVRATFTKEGVTFNKDEKLDGIDLGFYFKVIKGDKKFILNPAEANTLFELKDTGEKVDDNELEKGFNDAMKMNRIFK